MVTRILDFRHWSRIFLCILLAPKRWDFFPISSSLTYSLSEGLFWTEEEDWTYLIIEHSLNNKKIIFFFRKFGGIENLLFGQNREIPIYLFHLQMPRLCQLRRGTFYLQASRNLWLSDKSDHQVYSQPSNNPGQTRFVLSFRVPHTHVQTAPVRLSPEKVDKVEAVLWPGYDE